MINKIQVKKWVRQSMFTILSSITLLVNFEADNLIDQILQQTLSTDLFNPTCRNKTLVYVIGNIRFINQYITDKINR